MDDGVVGAAPAPSIVRGSVTVPPKYEKNALGQVVATERLPGTGGTISLKWPGYFQPSLDDVNKAATAAVAAMTGGIIDDETAVKFIAPYFKVEDKDGLLEKVRAGAAQAQADLTAQMTGGGEPDPFADPNAPAPAEPAAPPQPPF
jgi:hypothetical protein